MGQLHLSEVGDLREGTKLRGGGGSKIPDLSQTEKILYSTLESNRFGENQFFKK